MSITPQTWRLEAACRDMDLSVFFPPGARGQRGAADYREASDGGEPPEGVRRELDGLRARLSGKEAL